jgi:hypothetical protein
MEFLTFLSHHVTVIPAIVLSATTLAAAGVSLWTDVLLPRRRKTSPTLQHSARIFYFNDAKSRVASQRNGAKLPQADGRIYRLVSNGG